MRRKDREITELSRIMEIIEQCDCCRLGLVDGREAYIVPLSFGYELADDHLFFYFHCADEGRKLDLLPMQSTVSFEMDTKHELVRGELGCHFSYLYQCVMGAGTIAPLQERAEKEYGLQQIMKHYSGQPQWTFDDQLLNQTTVLKLSVHTLSCKEH